MLLPKPAIATAGVALAALVVTALATVGYYLERSRQRDRQTWEVRLGLAADARSDAITAALAADQRELAELASNAALQLYVARVARAQADGADRTDEIALAQKGYLHNLLVAAAGRAGFLSEAARLPANLPSTGPAGLALLDTALNPVVTTAGMRELESAYRDAAARALTGTSEALTDLIVDRQGKAILVYALPVPAPSGMSTADGAGRVGVLVGARDPARGLFALLARGPGFAEDNAALLVALRGSSVMYLSPGPDGTAAMRLTLPAARTEVAEVVAVLNPGAFAEGANYRGAQVIQASRAVPGTDWILVQQVDATQAFAPGAAAVRFVVAGGALLILAALALAVAVSRHARSVHAEALAGELGASTAKLRRRVELLTSVTDNVDVLTLLVGRDGDVVFANRAAAQALGVAITDLLGRHVSGVLDASTLQWLLGGIAAAGRTGVPCQEPLDIGRGEARRSFQASFLPVDRGDDADGPTLVVLTDVTELKRAQQRQADALEKLVATLVQAVDLHDPFAVEHARRMTEVADAVARAMELGEQERAALDTAATLANIGKIMIPAELLTKTEPLTESDWNTLRRHVDFSVDLLKSLDFDGPVRSIIAQKQEHVDGSGYPRGLTAGQMTLSGRILAVANAFVAMLSNRAYRDGISIGQALAELMQESDTRYDRGVVAALFHVAENRKDWSEWEQKRETERGEPEEA